MLCGNLKIVYVVLLKVQIALGGTIEGFNLFLFITKLANGATTYLGLHNHTVVRSKEYASPNPA